MPKNTQDNIQLLGKREEDKNYLTQPNVTSVRSRIFQNYVRERETENLEEQGKIMRKVDGHHKLELTCDI